MNNEPNSDIKKINEFIEKHSLQKILKILYVFFGGIILINVAGSFIPTKYYDCSNQGTQVVDKVLSCEQQKIDERVKEKEMEIEEFKVSEHYKMDKLKAVLSKVDLSNPEKLLSESVESLRALRIESESCTEKIIKTMCEVKFK